MYQTISRNGRRNNKGYRKQCAMWKGGNGPCDEEHQDWSGDNNQQSFLDPATPVFPSVLFIQWRTMDAQSPRPSCKFISKL